MIYGLFDVIIFSFILLVNSPATCIFLWSSWSLILLLTYDTANVAYDRCADYYKTL